MKERIDPLIDERAPWLECLDFGMPTSGGNFSLVSLNQMVMGAGFEKA